MTEQQFQERLKQLRSEMGRVGGKARTDAMTPEQRTKAARKAAKARWRKKR